MKGGGLEVYGQSLHDKFEDELGYVKPRYTEGGEEWMGGEEKGGKRRSGEGKRGYRGEGRGQQGTERGEGPSPEFPGALVCSIQKTLSNHHWNESHP